MQSPLHPLSAMLCKCGTSVAWTMPEIVAGCSSWIRLLILSRHHEAPWQLKTPTTPVKSFIFQIFRRLPTRSWRLISYSFSCIVCVKQKSIQHIFLFLVKVVPFSISCRIGEQAICCWSSRKFGPQCGAIWKYELFQDVKIMVSRFVTANQDGKNVSKCGFDKYEQAHQKQHLT